MRPSYSRLPKILTTILIFSLWGGVTASHASEDGSELILPPSSSELWIDIQNATLKKENISIIVTLDGKELPLNLSKTSFGFGQRLSVTDGKLRIKGRIHSPNRTIVNFVVADKEGIILKQQSMKAGKDSDDHLLPSNPDLPIVPLSKLPDNTTPSTPSISADSTPSISENNDKQNSLETSQAPENGTQPSTHSGRTTHSSGSSQDTRRSSIAMTGTTTVAPLVAAGLLAVGGISVHLLRKKGEAR